MAEGVKDGASLDDLDAMQDMWMMPDDRVGACSDQLPAGALLGGEPALEGVSGAAPPVDADDDPASAACACSRRGRYASSRRVSTQGRYQQFYR